MLATIFYIIRFYLIKWLDLDMNILLDFLLMNVPTASLSSILLMAGLPSGGNIPTDTFSSLTLKAGGPSGANIPTSPLSSVLLMGNGSTGPFASALLMGNGPSGGNVPTNNNPATGSSGNNPARGSSGNNPAIGSSGGTVASHASYIDKLASNYLPAQAPPSPRLPEDSTHFTKQQIRAFNRVSSFENRLLGAEWERYNASRRWWTAREETKLYEIGKPGYTQGYFACLDRQYYYQSLINKTSAEIQYIKGALVSAKWQKNFLFTGGRTDVPPLKNPGTSGHSIAKSQSRGTYYST